MEEESEMWALVELFGHSRLVGKVTEAEIGGGHLLRVEVPAVGDRLPLTRYVNVKAVYGLTPVDEATAIRMAKDINPAPVSEFSMQREFDRLRRLGDGGDEDDESHL